ncbi:16S rRNA (cytosine(1402)-N(4))-methyltransferase RsmH [Dongia sedimenti]|uniref:Ribosomal RNA small subunit methyltransferase H n=1 Tax=Dongia sedimenti TaxID=3064282 RepID=A0ABU0YGD2_9PROT|nr:16S rRNA (cytosine(1402)-N(4))-methyltransferase RsmH [Rhodospirillaceae bacterium R-7]
MSQLHKPVLLKEVIEALLPAGRSHDGAIFVDGTFGAGGYTRALLDAANCTVFAIDRDPDAIKGAAPLIERYAGRLHVIQGRFGDLARLLAERGVDAVSGITFDFGVSSMQLDQAARGFSFRFSGPLDMRMEQAGPSAADLVNEMAERPLADLIFTFGEERQARRIARAIVAARDLAPIETTDRLAEIVRRAIGGKPNPQAIDPATRTFQALRIAVNDELGEIDRGLAAAEQLLAPGGRLAVVSFHSLEDRRVKQFLRDRAGAAPKGSRHLPVAAQDEAKPVFRLIAAGGITASDEELSENPRSRSARLRIAEKVAA